MCRATIAGGPHLEKLAAKGDPKSYSLPLPLSNAKDMAVRHGADFSFAGLKTAVRQLVQKHLSHLEESEQKQQKKLGASVQEQDCKATEIQEREVIRANIAACFQARAVQHLSQWRPAAPVRWPTSKHLRKFERPHFCAAVALTGLHGRRGKGFRCGCYERLRKTRFRWSKRVLLGLLYSSVPLFLTRFSRMWPVR